MKSRIIALFYNGYHKMQHYLRSVRPNTTFHTVVPEQQCIRPGQPAYSVARFDNKSTFVRSNKNEGRRIRNDQHA